MESNIFALVRERAATYHALTEAYDQALRRAHRAGHNTPEMRQYLAQANGMAADVRDALQRYHAAVAELTRQVAMQD